jgi:hypothetical protein
MSWQRKSIPAPPGGIVAEVQQVVSGLGDTVSFFITGWPFSSVPKVLVWIPILTITVLGFFVLAFRSKRVVIVTVWFWVSFLVYSGFVRSGFYGYGQFGFRYTLILVPLFVLLIALTVAEPFHPPKWPARVPRALVHAVGVLAFVAALATMGLSAYSLPNRTLSQATRPGFAWPETEDVREVVQYWLANKEPQDPTYVYYGAVPAFRYYLRVEGVEAERPLPPAWQVDCWGDSAPDYCTSDNVYYGQWVRGLSPGEKRASMKETFGEMPPRFWLVFSHVSPKEDLTLLETLSHDYEIADSKRFVGAFIYLLDER